jgi:hypothetical protein
MKLTHEQLMEDALKGKLQSKKKEEEIPKKLTSEEYRKLKRKRYEERGTAYSKALRENKGIFNWKNDILNYI